MAQSNRPPRKYLTENMVNLHTRSVAMLTPDQLYTSAKPNAEQAEVLAACHIYLICRRPALTFDPSSFKYSTKMGLGKFIRTVSGERHLIDFQAPLEVPEGGRVEVSAYPHRSLVGFDATGKEVCYWPAYVIAIQANLEDHSIRDFEVVYVGQAFGDGSRSAIDRLRSHSTLQQILTEMVSTRPDDELMLLMFEYMPFQVISNIDGITKEGISGKEDTEHFLSIFDNPLSERQQIAIAEAGLIRYFAPEYNQIYKGSFPDDSHKILEDCYKLDFAALSVEINTEDIFTPLWSATRGRGVHHIANFDLHDPEKRRSFFSFVDREGTYTLMDTSGPIF